jgi:Raf kinase inhibitor-like YbhB/YbcL family protein
MSPGGKCARLRIKAISINRRGEDAMGLRSGADGSAPNILAGIPTCILACLAVVAGLAAQAGIGLAAEPFTLTSPAFKDGDVWPAKFAGADPSRTNPPCPGQNVSPPLSWSNAPANTKSFAIMMHDPDGGNGLGADHWVAYGIPASKTSLAEGEASTSPKDWTGGKNAVNSDHYFGPCGPVGHALHHYTITMVATDIEPGKLMPGLTRNELIAALRGHALAPASIIGRYTRPSP